MLQFIRKHQLLGGLLLFLVIASFVIFMIPGGDPFSAFGGGSGLGKINGKSVSQDELFKAQRMTQMFKTLYAQQARNYDDESEVYSRIIIQRYIDDLMIDVPEESIAKSIKSSFANPQTGKFSKELYDNALEFLKNRRLSEADLMEFVEQEIGKVQLMRMLSLAQTMVTPAEAKEVTRREQRRAKAKMVVFSGTNYNDQVQLNEEDLLQYYTNNMAAYRTREKRSVGYVEFPAANFADEAVGAITNLQERVDAMYEFRKDSMKDDEGNAMAEAEAKAQIRSEIMEDAARSMARTRAFEFARGVVPQLVATNLDAAARLDVLKSQSLIRGYEAAETGLFEQFGPVTGLDVGPEFNTAAFKLTMTSPVTTEPVMVEDSMFLLTLGQIQAPEVQPFAEVRSRVETSFKRDEVRKILQEAGESFHSDLTNQLASGSATFEDIIKDASKEVVDIPEFSLRTSTLTNFNSPISLGTIKNTAFGLAPGEVSRFVVSGQNGYIVKLEDFIPAPEDVIESEYTNSVSQIHMQMRSGMGGFEEWLQQEMVKAGFTASQN